MNSTPASHTPAHSHEWLETDGQGGFAMGTATGIRTRRYHALLLSATTPPTGRYVLVNGIEAWVETAAGRFALSSQIYAPNVLHPDGAQRIQSFKHEPWPTWHYHLEDGTEIIQELFVLRGQTRTVLSWRVLGDAKGVRLFIRLLLSGRDYHSLHHENGSFRFEPQAKGEKLTWQMYEGLPSLTIQTNARYQHDPTWYRNFLYEEEQARGLDANEDLAAPGIFEYDLTVGEAVCLLSAGESSELLSQHDWSASRWLLHARETELSRRTHFASSLERAVEDYLVTRSKRDSASTGKTIIAGYPWFADWGRDTFIALRGLCLATNRLTDAREILLEWSGAVSEGMLPNRFPDRGEQPEYNSVDASLWFVIAAYEYLEAANASLGELKNGKLKSAQAALKGDAAILHRAINSILEGYSRGTRFGIRADHDGLLAAGVPGVQLTWMDAKVGDWVVTPRIGKPVEVQALWLNALWIGSRLNDRWRTHLAQGLQSFRERFWNTHSACLFDVVDVNHLAGTVDTSFRPNQIFAVGGLPMPLLEGECARLIVEAVEDRLWTPLGLRSLAREEAGYTARYQGGVRERDGSYHQGTVWPWLIGPFVEAWLRVRGNTDEAKSEARQRFIAPLLQHLTEAGLGHVSEIADADAPHTPRGCPFQAWSVGELLRLEKSLLTPANKNGRKQTLQPV